jgi:SAM-dependent methyltransferase
LRREADRSAVNLGSRDRDARSRSGDERFASHAVYRYDHAFQNMAAAGSVYAARRVISAMRTILPVRSVIDIGCARGTWLREWQTQAVDDVIGVDGDYVDQSQLEIDPRCFVVTNLAMPFDLGRRFDLAQSLEVAEHLPPARAISFVADVVAHAPAVLFSAATPGQGGENHLNEQSGEFWRKLFLDHDYVAVDCLRPLLAKEQSIPAWYRYNLMLYVRRGNLERIAPFARQFQLYGGERISDPSPLSYRFRKIIVRSFPRSMCDHVARWNARRFSITGNRPGLLSGAIQEQNRVSGNALGMSELAKGSPERFGYSWDHYSDLLPEHEQQFLNWTTLDKSFWKGLHFVDAGCGIGRNSYWPMTYGAQGGLALDVDDRTLACARHNLGHFLGMEVRKQSIYEIAETNTFDIVFSIGVVHHLSDPNAAVARMARAAKPGGWVLVWLYGRENNGWIVHLFSPLRRALFSRLPLPFVHALSWPLTALLWCALRFRFPRGVYCRLIRGFSFGHLRAIVFDHMIPRIALYYTRAEAEALLARAGLANVRTTWVNENSWSVIGRKSCSLPRG